MQGENPVVMCEVFQNMWYAAQLTDICDSITGHVSKFEHHFSNLKTNKHDFATIWGFWSLRKWQRYAQYISKVKISLSHIHGVFMLVQIFVQYKGKQDLLKTMRNDKIMTNQSLWAPHSALLCGLGGGRHWESEEELDSVKTQPRLIKSHEGWWK